eukprot:COSAG01_NODE_2947_length_6810_cov_12.567342_8_plen_86_part_00
MQVRAAERLLAGAEAELERQIALAERGSQMAAARTRSAQQEADACAAKLARQAAVGRSQPVGRHGLTWGRAGQGTHGQRACPPPV